MGSKTTFAFVAIFTMSVASPALAYVGPGAGLSVIGALIGVLLAVGAAAAFVIGWPIRRMMRRRQQLAQTSGRAPVEDRVHPRDTAGSSRAR
ncbi:hypothetical protein [Parvibaculum lavamentivorans]|nr:hypothetical protein [Parvibaculum lavamentivorans]